MSLQETICPTRERLSKGDSIEAPEYSPTIDRKAYRVDHKFEELFKAGRINEGCMMAGMKLVRHYEGSLGSDVRISDCVTSPVDKSPDHDDGLSPRGRHALRLAEAESCIVGRKVRHSKRMWRGLMGLVKDTTKLEDIGRDWLGCQQRGQAYIAGLALMSMALEELSVLWGFSQSYHSRPPSR